MVGDNGEAWKAWLITSFLNSCCWDDVWISSCCDSCDCRCCVFLLCTFNSSYIWAVLFILYLLFFNYETNVDVHPKMISFQISRKRSKVNSVAVLIDIGGRLSTNAIYFCHCRQPTSFELPTKIQADGYWGISSFFSSGRFTSVIP